MCLGLDLIINNFDRFKAIWSSEGNINNMLIEIGNHNFIEEQDAKDRNNEVIDIGRVVFIDHSGNLLNTEEGLSASNFEKYL